MTALDKMQMLAKANEVGRCLTGDFAQVREIINKRELAVAIFADPLEPDGIGLHIVKGQHLLENVVATGEAREFSWTAIPCICIEQAIALRQVISKSDLH